MNRAMTEGTLVLLKKNGEESSEFPMLKDNVYKIGPSFDCHLRFNIGNCNESVCAIVTHKTELPVIHKLSNFPILLNDTPVGESEFLNYGDVIKIGQKTFKWTQLTKRESFTKNVFKNKFCRKSSIIKLKSKSTSKDSDSPLGTWQETGENIQISSGNAVVTETPMKVSYSETTRKSGRTTTPRSASSKNNSLKALPVAHSTKKFQSKSSEKKSSVKRKYFETNQTTSKIPRKFFPDLPDLFPQKADKNVEEKENMDTLTPKVTKKEPPVEEEDNAKTPDIVGIKPETPNIKVIKSANRRSASLKKSLFNKSLAQKRKISEAQDNSVNEPELFQDETTDSLFTNSLLNDSGSTYSLRHSKCSRNTSFSPKLAKSSISGIKTLSHTPKISPKSTNKKTNSVKVLGSPLKTLKKSPKNSTPKVKSNVKNLSFPRKSLSPVTFGEVSDISDISKMNESSICENKSGKSLNSSRKFKKSPKSPKVTSVKKNSRSSKSLSKNVKTPRSAKSKNDQLSEDSSPSKTPKRSVKKFTKSISSSTRKYAKKDLSCDLISNPEETLENLEMNVETTNNDFNVSKTCKTPSNSSVPDLISWDSVTKSKDSKIKVNTSKKLFTTKISPKNNSNISGQKSLLKITRGKPKSPKNDLSNVSGVKKLLKTPSRTCKSPKNDLTDVEGVKEILGSPSRIQQSPENDVTNVTNVKKLSTTPSLRTKTPKNDLTIIADAKKLLSTPRQATKSPKNNLTNTAGVKKLLKTSARRSKSPKNDLTNVTGVKRLLRTPRVQKLPKNDLLNVDGVKNLFRTPSRTENSPKNDLSNVQGVKELLGSPRRVPQSPKNDLTNIVGIKKLFKTPGRAQRKPKNDLSNVDGVKELFISPTRVSKFQSRVTKSPKNDLTNVAGVKKLFRSTRKTSKSPKNDLSNIPKFTHLFNRQTTSEKNDLTDVRGVKQLFRNPKSKQKSSKNYLVDVKKLSPKNRRSNQKDLENRLSNTTGVEFLFNTPNTSYSRMDELFDKLRGENNDSLNLLSSNSKSPVRTYERKTKSLSPVKLVKSTNVRRSLNLAPNDFNGKEYVQRWLNENIFTEDKNENVSAFEDETKQSVSQLRETEMATTNSFESQELPIPTIRSRRNLKRTKKPEIKKEVQSSPENVLDRKKNDKNIGMESEKMEILPLKSILNKRTLKQTEKTNENIIESENTSTAQRTRSGRIRKQAEKLVETEKPVRKGRGRPKILKEISNTPEKRATHSRTIEPGDQNNEVDLKRTRKFVQFTVPDIKTKSPDKKQNIKKEENPVKLRKRKLLPDDEMNSPTRFTRQKKVIKIEEELKEEDKPARRGTKKNEEVFENKVTKIGRSRKEKENVNDGEPQSMTRTRRNARLDQSENEKEKKYGRGRPKKNIDITETESQIEEMVKTDINKPIRQTRGRKNNIEHSSQDDAQTNTKPTRKGRPKKNKDLKKHNIQDDISIKRGRRQEDESSKLEVAIKEHIETVEEKSLKRTGMNSGRDKNRKRFLPLPADDIEPTVSMQTRSRRIDATLQPEVQDQKPIRRRKVQEQNSNKLEDSEENSTRITRGKKRY